MPWTLYWYILRDLLKLLVLATAVLVTVISFAVAIKPLTDGLLGPGALLRFVSYTAPTVLPFALPFAGAFAGTLVFCRMTADNEVQACSASGLSYARILLPVVILGLALTMGLFFLSGWVVPSFFERAERLLQKDVIDMLVNQVNRQQAFDRFKGLVIHADAAHTASQAPRIEGSAVQPTGRIILDNAALTFLDKQGKVRADATVRRIDVLLFSGPQVGNQLWATFRWEGAAGYNPTTGEALRGQDIPWEPVRLPTRLKDEPQFLSMDELRAAGKEPDRYDRVQESRRELATAIAAEQCRGGILAELRGGARSVLLSNPTERYLVRAPKVTPHKDGLSLAGAGDSKVRIEYAGTARYLLADEAELKVQADPLTGEPQVSLDLVGVKVHDSGVTTLIGEKLKWSLPRSRWAGVSSSSVFTRDSRQLLALAGEYRDQPAVRAAQQRLDHTIRKLIRKILGQLHSRAAAAVNCLLVLLLGAVLSLKMRGAMPLVVYFWTFLLAALSVIIVQSGRTLMERADTGLVLGLVVLWSGTALLAGATGWLHLRLRRY